MTDLMQMGQAAQTAAQQLSQLTAAAKNAALLKMATALEAATPEILEANAADLAAASELPAKFIDRLKLTPARVADMASGLRTVAALDDPTEKADKGWRTDAGLFIVQQRVPLGVVGMIYEARPNVTVDAAGLTLKSGNAVILRGGKEALHSNIALAKVLQQALHAAGLPAEAVQVIADPSRVLASQMMHMTDYIDVLIPRGGGRLDSGSGPRSNGAGDRNRRWQLPHLCRPGRGSGHGDGDCGQRQGAATERLQRRGKTADPPGGR